MRTLRVLTLLSAAVLLCSAAPGLEPLTCSEGNGPAAADKAVHHINEHHNHGYKFRLHEVQGNSVEQVDGGCNVKLQLDLRETKCHTINPKPFEDCEIRGMGARAVKANCTVLMTIKDGDASVTKYECDTRQEKTNLEMVRICPDCPVLLPLNNSEGLKSVREATAEFNKNTSNQHYYILKEVGRISTGYIMGLGMNYYPEFALVETHCPMGSRIIIEACIPLCPNRARHAFCRSSYSSQNGLLSTECDFYPAENTTLLGPGEKEPVCGRHGRRHPHGHGGPPPHALDHGRGPPPHAHDHGHGPPLDAGKEGRPPHAHNHGHGPPPDASNEGRPPHAHNHNHGPPPTGGKGKGSFHPLRRFHPCHGFLVNPDPALHPICPWPLPHRPHN
ncbi:alpha-2-HS-glycoprotein 1 isoform X2 [Simochromis diagramma]|uniref:alpha-2-HS-glycoprotein 1 isoform X2 n=1 Tax=Simochromis diagramma TaxID=43689 RepID=UPI001A7E9F42|nr:alpha-2-HS-glycoprotein 1 isoform X2 [Simochromis diagramma]